LLETRVFINFTALRTDKSSVAFELPAFSEWSCPIYISQILIYWLSRISTSWFPGRYLFKYLGFRYFQGWPRGL